MVEGLYEEDGMDAISIGSLPDIELQEDSLREKQRQRRRKRCQKRIRKLHSIPIFQPRPTTVQVPKSDPITSSSTLEADKQNLAGVRFSRLVDSRRISKDYYSQNSQDSQTHSPPPTNTTRYN